MLEPPTAEIDSVQYGILSVSDIERMSAVEITSTDLNKHGIVEQHGVNSAKMGPSSRQVICSTCGCTLTDCPGHMGMISLAAPVVNIEFIKMAEKILNCVCSCCSKLLIPSDHPKYEMISKISNVHDRLDMILEICKKNRKCYSHEEKLAVATMSARKRKNNRKSYSHEEKLHKKGPKEDTKRKAVRSEEKVERDNKIDRICADIDQREADMMSGNVDELHKKYKYCGATQPVYSIEDVTIVGIVDDQRLTASDQVIILEGISDPTIHILGLDPKVSRPASMYWQRLIIPPVCVRPARSKSHMRAKIGGEDDLTIRLRTIVKLNNSLSSCMEKQREHDLELARLDKAFASGSTEERCSMFLKEISEAPSAMKDRMKVITKATSKAIQVGNNTSMNTCLMQGTITFLHAFETFEKDNNKSKFTGTGRILKRQCKASLTSDYDKTYIALQQAIASYQDKSQTSAKKDGFTDYGRDRDCIRNLIIGKKKSAKNGLLRRGMMGKRVNYAARTVIVPDNSLDADEIGVPEHMCMTMSFPDRVSRWNIHKMEQLVRNGPDVYPGANYIIRGDTHISLKFIDRRSIQLQYGDIVERHLRVGDWMLFNRQPSLHKYSLMAHKCVPRKGNAIGMSLLGTTPYNADFDGDEMNLHPARDLMVCAEASEIFAVDKNIVKDKKPLVSFVQHAVIAAYLLTDENERLPLHTAHNLLYHNNYIDFNRIPLDSADGTISGRDMFAACLPEGTTVDYKDIRIGPNGFTAGQLTKDSINNGVVYNIWKDYGGTVACQFMSGTQRMLEKYLTMRGLTIGINDYDMQIPDHVLATVTTAKDYVDQVSTLNVKQGDNHHHPTDSSEQEIESNICRVLDKSRDMISDFVFRKIKKRKRINGCMVCADSGGKGNPANISQAMVFVGQHRNYKSARMCELTSHSKPNDRKNIAISRGFIDESFFSGMSSTQYFFHLACTMDGLVDTSVKTADTGGTQRRLAKAMENIVIKSDMVVRDGNDNIVQYRYCNDGLDPIEVEHNDIRFLDMPNLEETYTIPNNSIEPSLSVHAKARWKTHKAQYDQMIVRELDALKAMRKTIATQMNGVNMHTDVLCPVKFKRMFERAKTKIICPENERDVTPFESSMAAYDLAQIITKRHKNDRMAALFMDWCSTKTIWHEYKLDKAATTWLLQNIEKIFGTRVAVAHQSVGCNCAQNSAQPFTQLALNRFHISGQFSNLPVGLAKFKEIVNATQSPAVPSMRIFLKNNSNIEFSARKLCQILVTDVVTFCNSQVPNKERWITCREAMNHINLNAKRQKTTIDAHQQFNTEAHLVIHLNKSLCVAKMVTPRLVTEALRTSAIRQKKEYTKDFDQCLSFSSANDEDWWVCLSMPHTCIIYEQAKTNIITKSKNKSPSESMLLMYLYEKMCTKLVVRGCPDLAGFYIDESKITSLCPDGTKYTNTQSIIVTNGSNLEYILAHPEVDTSRTTSTTIMDMYEMFGIDAARECIESELRGVMSGSKAHVGDRHLTLISDAMCFRGFVTPMTYSGTCRQETSVLMKAVFEKTMISFVSGAIRGHKDNMNTISEAISWNGKIKCGTGCVTVFNDQHETDGQEHKQSLDAEFISRTRVSPPLTNFEDVFKPPTNRTSTTAISHTFNSKKRKRVTLLPTETTTTTSIPRIEPSIFDFKPSNAKHFIPYEP